MNASTSDPASDSDRSRSSGDGSGSGAGAGAGGLVLLEEATFAESPERAAAWEELKQPRPNSELHDDDDLGLPMSARAIDQDSGVEGFICLCVEESFVSIVCKSGLYVGLADL